MPPKNRRTRVKTERGLQTKKKLVQPQVAKENSSQIKNGAEKCKITLDSTKTTMDLSTLRVEQKAAVTPRVKRKYNRQTKKDVTDAKKVESQHNFSTQDVAKTKEISPQIESDAKKRKRQKTLDRSETLIDTTDSSIQSVDQKSAAAPRVKRKYNRRTKRGDCETDMQEGESQLNLSNSSLESAESRQMSPQMKNVASKRKRTNPAQTKSDTETTSSPLSNSSDFSPTSKTKQKTATKCKKKKVRFAKYSETCEDSTPVLQIDFLPVITESCKKHIKHIISTAVQFQRHGRRQRLTEADFVKALSFHNDFKIESEDCDIDCESEPLSFHGGWLNV